MASRRTSTRARTVKRYTNDAFEGLDIDDDDPTSSEPPGENDSDADGEFDGAADGNAAEEDEDDDDASVAESSNGSAPEEEEDESVVMMFSDDEELVGAAPGAPRRKGKKQGKKNFKPGYLERAENSAFKTGSFAMFTGKGQQAEESERKLSSRGVPEMYHNTGKDTRFMNLFGPAEEDVWPAVQARDRWHDRPTLPTRKEHRGEGGFAYNRYYTEECRQHEASKGWEWYHANGGAFSFKFKQKSKQLSASEATKYMPQTDGPDRDVLFGPITNPRLHTLKPDDAVNMAQFWDAKRPGKKSSSRQAWTLNLCKKIQCLEWAPWLDGDQRLAIAALQRPKFPAFTQPHSAPAFVPLPSTSASIQIWGFASKVEPGKGNAMDMAIPPRKELVICMDWGPVRELKWCPLPRRNSTDAGEINLGLLAGIWGDGKVRVLDVKYPNSASTQYIHITKAAFESRPPDTVCTSVTWLSSNQIAVSCANGSMAVWDISESLLSSEVVDTPRPWFYQNVHSSYILSIASAYPSHPFLVATSSMDGYLRLVDLRAPLQDTLLSQRSRTGSAPLTWHEVSQCFLTCDENYTLLALSARRFHVNMSVGRANSNILDLSASPVHPFVLVSCADGMALSTNIMRKVLIAKAEMWHQTWFMHEWRRAVDHNGVVTGASGGAISRDESKRPPPQIEQARPEKINHPGPLSRMLEGFRAEVYKLWVEAGLPNQYEGVVYNTIYEQETGITQLAWNPNIKYAGWAAAGMGDGLVRVEDIAI
ncbi:WD40-repeat-containing domain protein [Phyllosticta paracitricarpa]|uniref:WD40-repeat-containing domain protein n=1 Tax=Phyllosticta paracitricarpa TaxID=2016321 RepID=A0ABR1NJ39_9PEZI